jgi:hypothetical protein
MDVGDPRGWTGRPDPAEEEMRTIDWPDGCIAVASPGADEAAIRSTWQQLGQASRGVWRLTVQPVVPHLQVHLRPPELGDVASDRVVGPIRDLAATLARD